MIALWYLLGFVSGAAACVIVKLIKASHMRRKNAEASVDESFFSILNY